MCVWRGFGAYRSIGTSSIRCFFRFGNCRLSVSILSIFVESEIAKPLFSSIRRTAFHCKTAGGILFRGGVTVNMPSAVLQSKLHSAYSDQRFLILRCLAKSAPLPRAKKRKEANERKGFEPCFFKLALSHALGLRPGEFMCRH